jgi:hypothetical protein
LTVYGTTILYGPITLSNSLKTTGAVSICNSLGVSNSLLVYGNAILSNNVTIAGNNFLYSNASGNFTVRGSIFNVYSKLALSNQLSVTGTSLFTGQTIFSNILTFASNVYFAQPVTLSNTLDVSGICTLSNKVTISSNLFVNNNLGIHSSNPLVSLEINGSDAILLPVGTTLERPINPQSGYVRYNSTLGQYEGFGAASNWGSLGGVINAIQDTYIKAELFPGSPDDNLRFVTSNQERIRITSNGFIGIGTTTPKLSLQIVANDALMIPVGTTIQRPMNPQSGYVRYNSTLGQYEGFGAASNWGSLGGVINAIQDTYIKAELFPGSPDDNLRFVTSNQERMRITSNGYVGIGTTNPNTSFQIVATDAQLIPVGTTLQRPMNPQSGYVRYNSTLGQYEGFGAGSNWGSLGGVINATQDTYIKAELFPGSPDDNLRFVTSNQERIRITSNGFIGIGTTTPKLSLQIVANDALMIPVGTTMQRPMNPDYGEIRYNSTLGQYEGFGAGSNWGSLGGVINAIQDTYIKAELFPGSPDDNLRFVTSNQERIRITSNGYVGIGTTNPSTSFQIVATDAQLIPVGTTLQRPKNPQYGYVRYNSTLGQYEGFGAGSNWGSLGGVINATQDTYIKAELFPGSLDDNLRFITSNQERIRITSNGYIGFGVSNPSVPFEFKGDMKIDGNLLVTGSQVFTGPSIYSNSVIFASNTITYGNATFSNNVLLSSNLMILGQTSQCNTVWMSSNLNVLGISTFSNNVNMSSNLLTLGQTSMCNTVNISSNLLTLGQTSQCNTVWMSSNLNVLGISTFSNNVNMSSNLLTLGQTSMCNTVWMSSNLNVLGISTFSNNVNMSSNLLTLGQTSMCNTVKISSNLNVLGISTFSNNVNMSSNLLTLGQTSMCNTVNISSNLNVLGISTFSNNVNMSSNLLTLGQTSMCNTVNISSNLNVLGISTFSNNVNMSSNLLTLGQTSMCNTVWISSNLNVLGISTFSNNVNMSSNLLTLGQTSMCNTVNISSNLNVLGISTFSNNVNMSSNLEVYGETNFYSNLNISGHTSFSNYVDFGSNVIFDDNSFITVNTQQLVMSNQNNVLVTGLGGSFDFDQDVMIRDLTVTDTLNFSNANLQGIAIFGASNSNCISWSNVTDSLIDEFDGSVIVDSNLYVGGRLYCNGFTMTVIETLRAELQDLVVSGTATFCNALVEGVLYIGSTSNNPSIAYSNIPDSNIVQIEETLVVDSNLYVGGRIFCQGIQWSAMESQTVKDLVVYGSMTLCNTLIKGGISFDSEGYLAYSNIPDPNLVQIEESMVIDSNLYVGGRIFCNGFAMTACNVFDITTTELTVLNELVANNITASRANYTDDVYFASNVYFNDHIYLNKSSNTQWTIYLESNNPYSSELIFKSVNDTVVSFTDDFNPDILNFTGNHTCSFLELDIDNTFIGKIVRSTGNYKNLDNKSIIDINDSVPVVELCDFIMEKSIFGVISSIEETTKKREFKIGNLKFTRKKEKKDIKVVVNAVGEGAIWILDYYGEKLENGDLITSGPNGYGIKQNDDIIRNYTVGKITCDCFFDLNSKIYKCDSIRINDKIYKRAFVGVIYYC